MSAPPNVSIALHLAKPDVAPLGIYSFASSSALGAPVGGFPQMIEANMLIGGQWSVRRNKAATILLPGATKIMSQDVERLIANGRFVNLPRTTFDTWTTEVLSIDAFLTEENVAKHLAHGDALDIVDCVAKVLVTRAGLTTFIDVHRYSATLPHEGQQIVIELGGAEQFSRAKAADKRYDELVEACIDEHSMKRGKTGRMRVHMVGSPITTEALRSAAKAEMERLQAEEARLRREAEEAAAAMKAEQERLAELRRNNPALGMSDADLAAALRQLRGEP